LILKPVLTGRTPEEQWMDRNGRKTNAKLGSASLWPRLWLLMEKVMIDDYQPTRAWRVA
jgi:hypothetical protein